MATLVLAAAGSALGGVVGGSVAGIAAPVLGKAIGALAGGMIDQALLGNGSRVVETGRVETLRIQGSREGTPISRVFGRTRVAGTVIWATRFRETVSETRAGGKGTAPGATRRDHAYTVSLAIGLCEGPIDRIGRLWADGHEVALESLPLRLHRGAEDQPPDPLILALEGAGRAPGFRGTAYLVFEDLALAPWGNRVPQFSVEVFREAQADPALSPEIAPSLRELVQGVALSPGSGEFSLDTEPVLRRIGPGRAVWENMNAVEPRADVLLSLDQLEEELPACRRVSLVVSWFGNDLRMGACRLMPGVEEPAKRTEPVDWRVAGLDRSAARPVGRTSDGRPVFGGTPSDRGVIQTIRELKARGIAVTFYPFILMDIAPGNCLPDPWGGPEQAPYPWRGRITLDRAPGQPGSADGMAAAADAVAAFFGAATPGDFTPNGESVTYSGPAEWSLRRMVLHYAHLCALAGGVDAFCIGSELCGITRTRDGRNSYPAVAALRELAADVRAVLGPATRLGYAADWSEFFGHHPQDGTGDVLFHLDPLWADPAIDFVGIDNYMPLTDWRDGDTHLDAGAAASIYDLGYLRAGIEGGEGFDWYYASAADRIAQLRTPITDGAFGEPWVFRYKDIRSWWSLPHHERVDGRRSTSPTPWVPQSKPICFTELGCPAVDKGPNQPNVFLDAKSSESALPWFSSGAQDAHVQRRFLQAVLGYWADPANNPVSPGYGGPMVEPSAIHVWTWDARRWPDFPARSAIWADGANHATGHWITGRLGAAGLAETVAEICAAGGVTDVDVSELHGVVRGYALDRLGTARAALQPLMLAFGFDAVESGGVLRFVPRGGGAVATFEAGDLVARHDGAPLTLARSALLDSAGALRLTYVAGDGDYGAVCAESAGSAVPGARVETMELPLVLDAGEAAALVAAWREEAQAARATARFALPPSALAMEPGDVVRLVGVGSFRIDRLTMRSALEIEATSVGARRRSRGAASALWSGALPAPLPAPAEAVVLDLPVLGDGAAQEAPRLAVAADPWPGPLAVWVAEGEDDWRWVAEVTRGAVLGTLAGPLPPGLPWRWWHGTVSVQLHTGTLASAVPSAVLDGANRAAIEVTPGCWEVVQFASASLEAPGLWRLSGLLRGQGGTEALAVLGAGPGARFVLLDGAVVPLPLGAAAIGRHLELRVGPAGQGYDAPSVRTLAVAPRGEGLRPLAPVHARVERRDGGVAVRWVRRSRLDADQWGGHEVLLGEESEAYAVSLVDGARLLREAVVSTPEFLYADAARLADGPVGQVRVRVCQLSATSGPGHAMEIMIDG